VGGVNECIVHGETGLLCRPSDAMALADTLRQMIASPELRQSLGARAYERAVGTYSLSAQRQAVAAVYRDALSRRSATETVSGGGDAA